MLGPYNSAQSGGLQVAASHSNTGDTLHTGKLVKLMDKANFPFFSVSRDVRDALSTRIRPRVVGGREVRSEDADDAGNTTFMLFDFIFVRRRRT